MSKRILINNLNEIEDAASRFLEFVDVSNVIAFYGTMGAGKTTFIKAICKVLGVPDTVNSPTFTIINEYRTKEGKSIYHFDFYRIDKIEEAYDIGFDEFVENGNLSLIEWPEKIETLLPDNTLRVQINVLENEVREIIF
ncbi:MAG TPA: tRNA (adenosine(37)-N6)-threonylcarbamoyltransferase complex ATPase subunit type 1 TsaE [Bacteroidales bacterium]|mgnify:CR=1 FL=1|jgi:tRNA threonylcarbamoyladenosine biosynthesis protein TsaE|nr:tRNA (adenosine(37)-N6)-threonylcarbamoyltransferase complex ATPase subunit type 1 TsaE [Bacteroidales bacterium]HRT84481.1 tRNA (adenosine(37)-N6)-threonylcarbamoyltransferase complex ATPase subunit type 1 TsaE [Bacteroidales bacterium]